MKNYGILTFLDLLQAWYKKRKGFITFTLLTAQCKCDAENQVWNKLSNGPLRAQSNVKITKHSATLQADISDGAIVGSAIIKLIEKYGADAPEYVAEYVKSMKDAIRS